MPTGERCWKQIFPLPLAHYGILGPFTAHKSRVVKKGSNLSALLLRSPKVSFMTTKCQAVWSGVCLAIAPCQRLCFRACSGCCSLPRPPGRARLRAWSWGTVSTETSNSNKEKRKNKVGTFLFGWAAFFTKFCKMHLLLGFSLSFSQLMLVMRETYYWRGNARGQGWGWRTQAEIHFSPWSNADLHQWKTWLAQDLSLKT